MATIAHFGALMILCSFMQPLNAQYCTQGQPCDSAHDMQPEIASALLQTRRAKAPETKVPEAHDEEVLEEVESESGELVYSMVAPATTCTSHLLGDVSSVEECHNTASAVGHPLAVTFAGSLSNMSYGCYFMDADTGCSEPRFVGRPCIVFNTNKEGAGTDAKHRYICRVEETTEDAASASLTEEGFKMVSDTCCTYQMDIFVRRVLADRGYEVCDEGCHNGFTPFFSCTTKKETHWTLAKLNFEIESNAKDACPCYAVQGQCQPLADSCPKGTWDPTAHRRRNCPSAPVDTTQAPTLENGGGDETSGEGSTQYEDGKLEWVARRRSSSTMPDGATTTAAPSEVTNAPTEEATTTGPVDNSGEDDHDV